VVAAKWPVNVEDGIVEAHSGTGVWGVDAEVM